MFEHVIDGRKIEVHLAGVLRLECSSLQVDVDETSKLQMVEEQIEPVVLASNVDAGSSTLRRAYQAR